MTTRWPLGDHLETTRWPLVDHLVTSWWPLGDHLVTTWWLLGDHLVSTWWLLRDYLVTTWWLLGDHLVTTWWHLGHVWGMSGTTSGAYCQQWTTIRGATCICNALGALSRGAFRGSSHPTYISCAPRGPMSPCLRVPCLLYPRCYMHLWCRFLKQIAELFNIFHSFSLTSKDYHNLFPNYDTVD